VVAQPRESKQVYFALAWPAPPYVSPERYGWHVLAAMFGGGPTSRLFRALREERGLVYHIEAQYQAYAEAGALVVEGATLPETLVPVLAGILIELLLLGENEINLDDYHRTVQSLVSQHLVSGDSAYVRMSRLALQELYFQQAVTSEEVVAGLRSLSLETIRLTAQRVFAAGVPSMALVGPVSEPLLEAVGDMLCDFGGNPTLACAPRGLPDPATLVSEDAPTLPSAR
jgi:predicted Zn-dependent peptidase